MNELYMRSVTRDRERVVSKIVKENQYYRYLREPNTDERDSAGQSKHVLSSWLMMVGKRIKGVLEFNNKGDVKV